MNKLNKILISAAIVASGMSLGSCVNDLDLLPTDPNTLTAANFAENPEHYMDAVMADVYLQFATYGANGNSAVEGFDGGMATFQRASFILQEVPSDEACWLSTQDVDYGDFEYGIVPTNNRVIFGTYSRYYINITLCNDFIQTVRGGYFNLNTDELRAKADEYIRQCLVLRSACYWYLVDCWGNVPYADEETKTGSVPPQLSRKEVFDRVTKTLEDVVAEYEQVGTTPTYGHVGKEVAEALLVKFYLNAEVYTGTPRWADCVKHANNIIAAHTDGFEGTGLCNYYNQLFAANNDLYAIGGAGYCHEILWTIPQRMPGLDPTNPDDNKVYQGLTSYANGTFMVNAWLGEVKDLSLSKYNAGSQWKCMVTRRQFVEKFDWDDPQMTTSKDTRVANWVTSAYGFPVDNPVLDLEHYGDNGYVPMKFTNYKVDPATGEEIHAGDVPTAGAQYGIDYPMIRLAEIYMSAAEAAYLNGDAQTALKYCNIIRKRAGLDAWTAADCTLQAIRDERCRELYTEATRRSDLIRANQWISGYTWNWKNKVAEGADFAPYFNLYPLPSSIVTGAGYTQNPGY